MSGGYWNYEDNDAKNAIFRYASKQWNALEDREVSELVWDVFELLHYYDWYISGDTCEETYLKHKAAFKEKWLKDKRVRVKRIVDNAVEELRTELYKTFEVKETDEQISS